MEPAAVAAPPACGFARALVVRQVVQQQVRNARFGSQSCRQPQHPTAASAFCHRGTDQRPAQAPDERLVGWHRLLVSPASTLRDDSREPSVRGSRRDDDFIFSQPGPVPHVSLADRFSRFCLAKTLAADPSGGRRRRLGRLRFSVPAAALRSYLSYRVSELPDPGRMAVASWKSLAGEKPGGGLVSRDTE